MVCICKEYGTLKVYPLEGKDDVKAKWGLFKRWIEIITPYVVAKLGVKPEIMIVGTDRGSEFITTAGKRRGELDEELFNDNIFRWTPSAGDSNKLGKVERANRTIVTEVNAMLRIGGARNNMAYYALTMFEQHYNCTRTAANGVGHGEAPFKTLGIPFDLETMVRFFCPAYIKMDKSYEVGTGKVVAQNKFVERMIKCFIIGYGGKMAIGVDHDGFKVIIPSREKAGEAVIYASNNVFPQEHLVVTRSLLKGATYDALEDGDLVHDMFDVEGTEELIYTPRKREDNGKNEEIERAPNGIRGQQSTHRGHRAGTSNEARDDQT
jgi:hypothetical protein